MNAFYQATPCYAGAFGPTRVFPTQAQATEWAEAASESYGVCYVVWGIEPGEEMHLRLVARYAGLPHAA